MMLPVLVAALLAAEPQTKIAATKFNVIDLSEARADFYTDHFADRLADQGVTVMTPREITSMIGLERQKQLLGCTNETSACIAEIGNALGVDGIILGDIAKVGDAFQVNIKIIASEGGKRLASHSAMVRSEVEVLEELTYAANKMAISLQLALGRTPPQAMDPPKRGPVVEMSKATTVEHAHETAGGTKRYWWIPAVVGVAGFGVGAYGLVTAADAKTKLDTLTMDRVEADDVLASGQRARTLGTIGIAVGAAGLATAAALFVFGSDASVAPTVSLTNDSVGLGFGGALP